MKAMLGRKGLFCSQFWYSLSQEGSLSWELLTSLTKAEKECTMWTCLCSTLLLRSCIVRCPIYELVLPFSPEVIQLRKLLTGMFTGWPKTDNSPRRITSQVILPCVQLIITSHHKRAEVSSSHAFICGRLMAHRERYWWSYSFIKF